MIILSCNLELCRQISERLKKPLHFREDLMEIRSLSFSASPHFGPCSFASLRTRFGDNEHSCVIITVNCKRFVKPTRAVIMSSVIYNKKALPAANRNLYRNQSQKRACY